MGEDAYRYGLETMLNDGLFACDFVTGNASGTYTTSRNKAKDCVTDNLDLPREAYDELGTDDETVVRWLLSEDSESMDVTIRYRLLAEYIGDVSDGIMD